MFSDVVEDAMSECIEKQFDGACRMSPKNCREVCRQMLRRSSAGSYGGEFSKTFNPTNLHFLVYFMHKKSSSDDLLKNYIFSLNF